MYKLALSRQSNESSQEDSWALENLFVGALCNGSTTDFDSVSLGSIPSAPANFNSAVPKNNIHKAIYMSRIDINKIVCYTRDSLPIVKWI